jgi:hypothetical protein
MKMTDESKQAKADAKAARAKAKALRPWYKKKRFIGLIVIAGIAVIAVVSQQDGDDPTSTNSDANSQVSEDEATEDEATEDTVGTGLGSKDASGDIDDLDCGTPDAIGVRYPSVKITNRSEKRSNYFITVSFESSDGSTKYDETIIMVMSLNPGQSMTEEGFIANEIPDGAICKVTEVQRTSDE